MIQWTDGLRSKTLVAVWVGVVALNMIFLPRQFMPEVTVEKAALAPLALRVRAAGNLEAKDSTTLKAQFEGPVLKKNFHEGQIVRKGQLLAVLSREKIKLDYESKRDALKNAESDLERARKDLRLEKVLFKREAVSYSSVEDAQRALTKADQGLRAAKETFQLAQDLWESSEVTSPIAGTIVKDWLGDEKSIGAGKEIVTVADVSEYTVRARVDELDLHQIEEGMKADVRLQVYPERVFTATLRQLGSQPDGNGLPQIPIVLTLDSTQGLLLRPKLSAEVRIHTGSTPPTLSVPLSSIVNADGQQRVWVVGSLNRLRAQAIELGRSNPDRVLVIKGLQVNDRVCLSPDPHFATGMKVRWVVSRPHS